MRRRLKQPSRTRIDARARRRMTMLLALDEGIEVHVELAGADDLVGDLANPVLLRVDV